MNVGLTLIRRAQTQLQHINRQFNADVALFLLDVEAVVCLLTCQHVSIRFQA